MSGGRSASQNDCPNSSSTSSLSPKAFKSLSLALSNIANSNNVSKNHHHDLASFSGAVEKSFPGRKPGTGRVVSTPVPRREHDKGLQTENSLFYLDGLNDKSSDAIVPVISDWEADCAVHLPNFWRAGLKRPEDIADVEKWNWRRNTEQDKTQISSDNETSESSSTIDPQSPQTPDDSERNERFLPKNGESSVVSPLKLPSLDIRLRPSQRNEASNAIKPTFGGKDRFISRKKSPVSSRNSYFMSKHASKLTPNQRAYRRRTGFSDPFEPQSSRSRRANIQNSSYSEEWTTSMPSPVRANRILGSRREPGSMGNPQARAVNFAPMRVNLSTVMPYSTQRDEIRNPRASRLQGRVHTSKFLRRSTPGHDRDIHEKRIALALDVDQAERVLPSQENWSTAAKCSIPIVPASLKSPVWGGARTNKPPRDMVWRDNKWMHRDGTWSKICSVGPEEILHTDQSFQMREEQLERRSLYQQYLLDKFIHLRLSPLWLTSHTVLEAPLLRDDFYCSVLAYSHKADRLAVALGFKVYLWSEDEGTIEPPAALDATPLRTAYVTSLAFSSEPGSKAILAVGRGDGRVLMWSPLDHEPRFLRFKIENAASHLSFRPSVVRRPSQRHQSLMAENEVFLVGDDTGVVWIYFVEWPEDSKRFLFGWHGGVSLHARIVVHTQQICGIAWSPNGEYFATGGNDNLCSLFQHSTLLGTSDNNRSTSTMDSRRDGHGNTHMTVTANDTTDIIIRGEHTRNMWKLSAAIKAIAFCPWQSGLLAVGGGSNDRCIHFYHTFSGACLAIIDCAAQVTSLVWSTTRREIAATFGFAQPEHPFRVAVYAWPSCEQIVAIPWMSEMRALHAIAYPGRPEWGRKPGARSRRPSRGVEEGCMVIAGSDGSIKFHEIWSQERRGTLPHQGLLGGSDILESLHGIDKDGQETIR